MIEIKISPAADKHKKVTLLIEDKLRSFLEWGNHVSVLETVHIKSKSKKQTIPRATTSPDVFMALIPGERWWKKQITKCEKHEKPHLSSLSRNKRLAKMMMMMTMMKTMIKKATKFLKIAVCQHSLMTSFAFPECFLLQEGSLL